MTVAKHRLPTTTLLGFLQAAMLMFLPSGFSYAVETPKIDNIKRGGINNVIVINGKYFGEGCARCEVIANYGTIKYALKVREWKDNRISVVIPDLGYSLEPGVTVIVGNKSSNGVGIRLIEVIQPVSAVNRIVRRGTLAGLEVHEFISKSNLGENGQHRYSPPQKQTLQCNKKGFIFHKANLVIGRRTRFAEAQITKTPPSACRKCSPIYVKYFVEPTGYLHYQIHIYQRQITGTCPARIRR